MMVTPNTPAKTLVNRYEILEFKINNNYRTMPLREQVKVTKEMDVISEVLKEAYGMNLNYFGRWE